MLAQSLALALSLSTFVGAAALAAVQPHDGKAAPIVRLMKTVSNPIAVRAGQVARPKSKAPQFRVVWRGLDVDGDGAADFANPTGEGPRGADNFGSGAYGASRDGGHRRHEGVDYVGRAGQDVMAPISGFVSKIGYVYSNSGDLRFVEITNPALGYVARAFYVKPSVTEGQAVALGDTIGHLASLQSRYPGITNHVHLEIHKSGFARLNANDLIYASREKAPPHG